MGPHKLKALLGIFANFERLFGGPMVSARAGQRASPGSGLRD